MKLQLTNERGIEIGYTLSNPTGAIYKVELGSHPQSTKAIGTEDGYK
jgi:hypothetical protein